MIIKYEGLSYKQGQVVEVRPGCNIQIPIYDKDDPSTNVGQEGIPGLSSRDLSEDLSQSDQSWLFERGPIVRVRQLAGLMRQMAGVTESIINS